MTRVLFIDHVDRVLGGAEINLIELIEEAQKHNDWQIAVACREGSLLSQALAKLNVQQFDYGFGSGLNTLRFAGKSFPWMRLTGGLRALNQASSELGKIIETFKPTVAISCTNKDHFASVKACRRRGVRSVWWVNDLMTEDFFPLAARLAFRRYSRSANALVAVSNTVAAALPFAGDRVRVIHNGIPVSKYTNGKRGAFRAQELIRPEEPVFGLIGRMCEWKGHFTFLEIAEKWRSEERDGRFVMIGQVFNEDEAFGMCLEQAAQHAHFTNPRTNVADALADMDVLLHTSLRPEPFGRVIIEAMAAGVPVIAADSGGAREIIASGVNGYLAKTGDSSDYLAKLKLLYPRTPAVGQIISNAKATVAERFTVERVYRDFAALIVRP